VVLSIARGTPNRLGSVPPSAGGVSSPPPTNWLNSRNAPIAMIVAATMRNRKTRLRIVSPFIWLILMLRLTGMIVNPTESTEVGGRRAGDGDDLPARETGRTGSGDPRPLCTAQQELAGATPPGE